MSATRRQVGRAALASLALLAAIGAALALGRPGHAAPRAQDAQDSDPRPNIIVLMTDDQDVASLEVMENVRRLIGGRGTTFENSFASFPLCCPSRATFLTGQYAHNHGVFDNVEPLGGYSKLRGASTLPVWLRKAGYRTIHVGKYLNGYGRRDPTEIPPGWTDWHGLVGRSTYHYYGFTINDNGRPRTFSAKPSNYQTGVLTRKAVSLIGRASRGRKPFFMWAAFLAPHFSYDEPPESDDPPRIPTPVPAPRDRNRFAGEPLPTGQSFDERDVGDKPATVRQYPPLTESQRAGIEENYQQELEALQAVDRGVGRIVRALREGGELGRTLLVFSSDNGYFHGEHRIPFGKTLPYEPDIRVPLVVRGPGLPHDVHRTKLVSNQDLAPTILDAANARAGLPEDGLSLMPLMRHRKLARRDLLVEGYYPLGRVVRFAGIRAERWFYAEYSNGERELYDLTADPEETTSRSGDPRYDAVEANLALRLAALRHCRGASCRRRVTRASSLGRVR